MNIPRITLAIAFIIVFIQLYSCSLSHSTETSKHLDKSSNMPIDINELQSFAHIKLPRSYRDIKVHQEYGIDRMIAFRFTMDIADLNEFITSANYNEKLVSTELERGLYTDDFKEYSWWKPDDAKKILSGSYLNNKWGSRMLIDLTNSPTIIVYMQVTTL